MSAPPTRRVRLSLSRVRAALASSPLPAEHVVVVHGERRAAVLVTLFEEAGETRVVLTRRSSALRSHTSEVSFPGGQADVGETLVDAALREAWEEVALDPASVEVAAALGSLTTVSSNALITPFVGILPGRPVLSANPFEVDRVFDVALADLLVDGVHHSELWQRGEVEIELHFFEVPGDIIWGATARILVELLGLVMASSDPAASPGE